MYDDCSSRIRCWNVGLPSAVADCDKKYISGWPGLPLGHAYSFDLYRALGLSHPPSSASVVGVSLITHHALSMTG